MYPYICMLNIDIVYGKQCVLLPLENRISLSSRFVFYIMYIENI